MLFYKDSCGEPYRIWTRLNAQTTSRKSDFVVFNLVKFGAPSGPHVQIFLRPLLFFSANDARARPGQNSEKVHVLIVSVYCLTFSLCNVFTQNAHTKIIHWSRTITDTNLTRVDSESPLFWYELSLHSYLMESIQENGWQSQKYQSVWSERVGLICKALGWLVVLGVWGLTPLNS